jgi:hypothetical protein
LELLTRGLHIQLDAEQTAKLVAAIEALDKDEEMAEEAAKVHLDAINQLLTSENIEVLSAIELPRGRSGSAGGAAAGRGAGPAAGGGGGGPSTGGAGARGGQQSNENPFKQEENAKRLQSLRERLASTP